MSNVLHCGNCGAPVQVPPGAAPNALVTCPFCGVQVERAPVAPSLQVPASGNVRAGMPGSVQQAEVAERGEFGAVSGPTQHSHYVSGESGLRNVPLSEWEPGLEPPARRPSGVKGILIGVLVVLVLVIVTGAVFPFVRTWFWF